MAFALAVGTLAVGTLALGTLFLGPAPVVAQESAAPEPVSELGTDALFDLLVGELAAREGDQESAARRYLSAAQRTGSADVAQRATRLALQARDYDTALMAARLWGTLDPDSNDALQASASLLLYSGDPSAEGVFIELFERLKQANPDQAYPRLGELLARGNNRERADEVMRALVERDADNPVARLALARYYARSERFEDALGEADTYLELVPDDAPAITLKAELLRRLERVDDALKVLAEGVERMPDNVVLRSAYARALVSVERYEDARVQYEAVLALAPDNTDNRYALALMLLQEGDMEPAREQFEVLTKDMNRRYGAWYYLGRIAESEARYDDALAAYRRVDRGDQRMSAQMRYAQVLGEQGKIEEARAHLHGLQGRSDEERVALVRAEGDLLAQSKRYADAMTLYDGALREHADNANLLYARAMMAEKVDRIDVLERDLRQIIGADPENADALNALGYTLADRTERYEEALALIRKAVELQPESHYIIDSLGWVLYRMGRLDEAATELRRAFELRPDAEIGAHLGEVLWMLGEREEAESVWDQALKSRPDDETLLETRKRFGL